MCVFHFFPSIRLKESAHSDVCLQLLGNLLSSYMTTATCCGRTRSQGMTSVAIIIIIISSSSSSNMPSTVVASVTNKTRDEAITTALLSWSALGVCRTFCSHESSTVDCAATTCVAVRSSAAAGTGSFGILCCGLASTSVRRRTATLTTRSGHSSCQTRSVFCYHKSCCSLSRGVGLMYAWALPAHPYITLMVWVRSFIAPDLFDNNVPFDNTTPIYLISLLWKLVLRIRVALF